MLEIKVSKVKKYYSDRLLLNIENLCIFSGEKVGLVGVNGCGKSTLLNIISRKITADEGDVYLENNFSYITQQDEEIEICPNKISSELNIPKEYNSYLSGGEKVKAKISKALSENTKIIIADEPTSNLDEKSINYIENKFKEFKGTILVVSHDREFLDNICNRIIEIDNGVLRQYKGNYTAYINQKNERFNREMSEYKKYINERDRLNEAIRIKTSLRDGIRKAPRRFGNSEARLFKMGDQSAKKNMDNSIKAIKSRIDRLEVKEKPKENQIIRINISEGNEFYSNYPIEVKNLNISYDDKEILKDVSLKIRKNKKVALLGDNGCGKSSLIEQIVANNENVKIANRVKIGYFKQNLEVLKEDKSVLDNIKENSSFNETFIRIVLARFLCKEEEVYKKVSVLSGGEKVRVALCKIILGDNNLLILDEPTNYLDIISMEALEEALIESNKTMLIVSHDRRFIEKICNEVCFIEEGVLKQYPYSYKEYISNKNKPILQNKLKINRERIMLIENRIAEVISLISLEGNEEKKLEYDDIYKGLLKELKELKG